MDQKDSSESLEIFIKNIYLSENPKNSGYPIKENAEQVESHGKSLKKNLLLNEALHEFFLKKRNFTQTPQSIDDKNYKDEYEFALEKFSNLISQFDQLLLRHFQESEDIEKSTKLKEEELAKEQDEIKQIFMGPADSKLAKNKNFDREEIENLLVSFLKFHKNTYEANLSFNQKDKALKDLSMEIRKLNNVEDAFKLEDYEALRTLIDKLTSKIRNRKIEVEKIESQCKESLQIQLECNRKVHYI